MQIPENNYDDDNFWENCPAAQVSPEVRVKKTQDLLDFFYRLESEGWGAVRRCVPFYITCNEDTGENYDGRVLGGSIIRRNFEGPDRLPITFLY